MRKAIALVAAFGGIGVVVLLTAARSASEALGPTGCGPDTRYMADVLSGVKWTLSDAELRDSLRIPRANAAESIVAVRKDSLCKVAGARMNSDFELPATTSRQVYLVRIGTSRYWAEDPTIREGEWGVGFVMDSTMATVLSRAAR
ncbi:MAG: hypothetical protein V4503_07790 [Gemmatimonadota bacterium]